MSDGYTDGWRAAAKAADATLEVPCAGPMFFRRVPVGEFWMGSRDPHPGHEEWTQYELPRHRVVVEREFWLGTFPVTQRQFNAWANAHPHRFDHHHQRPAENLDWHQAKQFCAWLGEQAGWRGFVPGLPSEAAWEYACRAGAETDYCSGDGEAALREVGWFAGNSDARTHEVGELRPNAWGLYDMHGNVWEWCRDPWHETKIVNATGNAFRKRFNVVSLAEVEIDGSDLAGIGAGPARAGRVVRGGSWMNASWACRAPGRYRWLSADRSGYRGFRVCLLPAPSGPTG